MKTKEEIRIEFYGEHDARAYDHDELYIMEQYAKEYHEQQVNLLNKPAVSGSLLAEIERLINKYKEERLPNRNMAFHYEAEIDSGFNHFMAWLISNDR